MTYLNNIISSAYLYCFHIKWVVKKPLFLYNPLSLKQAVYTDNLTEN